MRNAANIDPSFSETTLMRFAISLVACLIGAPVLAQTTFNSVDDYQNWSVFVTEDPRQCFIANRDTETEITFDGAPATANRGDPFLYVTHTPGTENDVISVFLGFPPDRNAPPELRIDGTSYTMLPGQGRNREWAWIAPKDDKAVLTGMISGQTAQVVSTSTTNKIITDSFSLLGFTDALNNARSRCSS